MELSKMATDDAIKKNPSLLQNERGDTTEQSARPPFLFMGMQLSLTLYLVTM
jgi:hypothetical protein